MTDKPEYLLISERLGFRNWAESDKHPFALMNANANVMRHFPAILDQQSSDELVDILGKHFDHFGFTYFAVDELSSGRFIGFIGLKKQSFEYKFTPFFDIGWRLAPEFWGKGYATEGAITCLQYGFEVLKLPEIYAVASHLNVESINVMKKIGMKLIDHFIHPAIDEDSALQPCHCYKISSPQSVS
ncbi:MAG: GNAT family N-acetyltransferase [Cyclobacteriaceae bacterium]